MLERPISPAELPMTTAARVLPLLAIASALGAQSQRPMTFLDAQNMRQVSGQDISPNGRMMLYALSTPDWNQARRQSDIYLVNVDQGIPSTRHITFSNGKNESSALCSLPGSLMAFLSDRDAA